LYHLACLKKKKAIILSLPLITKGFETLKTPEQFLKG